MEFKPRNNFPNSSHRNSIEQTDLDQGLKISFSSKWHCNYLFSNDMNFVRFKKRFSPLKIEKLAQIRTRTYSFRHF